MKPFVHLFYTVEFVYNSFVCNVNSPITLHFIRSRWHHYMHLNSLITVVLNRGYMYPLGVPNTETGGTKHRHFYEYTP